MVLPFLSKIFPMANAKVKKKIVPEREHLTGDR